MGGARRESHLTATRPGSASTDFAHIVQHTVVEVGPSVTVPKGVPPPGAQLALLDVEVMIDPPAAPVTQLPSSGTVSFVALEHALSV
jgi:hypothetical protein